MGQFTDRNKRSRYAQKLFIGSVAVLAWACAGCGAITGAPTSVPPPATAQSLTAADVSTLVQTAAQAADPNTMVIAVVDREGNVLGVYRKPSAPSLVSG